MFNKAFRNRMNLSARLLAAGLLALFGTSGAWAATMQDSMMLAPNDEQVLEFPANITKVSTSNPAVVSVTVSASKELLVTAKEEGSTDLSVWTKGNSEPQRSSVVVTTTASKKMPFGTQVQTDIQILEVSKSKLNQLGMSYSRLYNNGRNAVGIAPPGQGYAPVGNMGTSAQQAIGDGFNLFAFGRQSLMIIQAMESGGYAYTLAKPSLTSLSGQTASFLSGGEFPVPTRGGTGDGSIQVEYKSFGVGLNLTPTVINGNQIILKVAPEVSELDFSTGVETGGVKVPGIRVRRAETTVSLAPEETFIISGLVSRNTTNNSDRVPGLGNIPIIGAFFRSSNIKQEDKEMVMVVTPHLVTPDSAPLKPSSLPANDYKNSSLNWIDMATQTRRGSEPVKRGLSW